VSGDLRNILLTVNALPLDYSGQLTILLNDNAPHVVLRNMLLLSILGKTENRAKAVDVALHTWYSAFVPSAYQTHTTSHAVELLESCQDDASFSADLGANSSMKGTLDQEDWMYLAASVTSQYDAADANRELNRIRSVRTSTAQTHTDRLVGLRISDGTGGTSGCSASSRRTAWRSWSTGGSGWSTRSERRTSASTLQTAPSSPTAGSGCNRTTLIPSNLGSE
jgi:hypothetical protein